MSGRSQHRPSASFWLRVASWIVPWNRRAAWRRQYENSFECLRTLDQRGELASEASACFAWLCRDALLNAVSNRFGQLDLQSWARSPLFFMLAASAALVIVGFATHGFSVTRSLLQVLRNTAGPYPDRVIANSVPIVFAVLVGGLTAAQHASRLRRGWGCLGFLLFKVFSLEAITLALWIEGGAALRASIHSEILRAFAGGLALAILFVAAFDWVIVWIFDDQYHRCPVCLRRMVKPVRIGSWASVFEPVTTEWLCEAGHGSVCMHEIEQGESEWIKVPS